MKVIRTYLTANKPQRAPILPLRVLHQVLTNINTVLRAFGKTILGRKSVAHRKDSQVRRIGIQQQQFITRDVIAQNLIKVSIHPSVYDDLPKCGLRIFGDEKANSPIRRRVYGEVSLCSVFALLASFGTRGRSVCRGWSCRNRVMGCWYPELGVVVLVEGLEFRR